MKKILSAAIASAVILTSTVGLADAISDNTHGVVGGDLKSGDIVYESNADKPIAIASTTKIMTYLVIRDEIAKGNGSLEELVEIDAAASNIEGSSFDLKEGEKVSVKMLLESIMMVSANDSCIALAKHFGGDIEGFVDKMNDKAKELGLKNTVYYTPNGLEDSQKRENTMTTRELFKLTSHVLKKYPDIIEITKKTELVVPSRNFAGSNTNNLLKTVPGVDGLKTGFTDLAGSCLVATGVQRDDENDENRVIGIVMGTDSPEARDQKSGELMKQLINNYESKNLFENGETISRQNINGSEYSTIEVTPKEDIIGLMKSGEKVSTEVEMLKEVDLPIEPGDTVGKIVVSYGNVKKEELLTVSEKIGHFKMIGIWISNWIGSMI